MLSRMLEDSEILYDRRSAGTHTFVEVTKEARARRKLQVVQNVLGYTHRDICSFFIAGREE